MEPSETISAAVRNQLIDELRAEGIQVFMTVAEECDFNITDLQGNPVEARVIIPPRAQPAAPVPRVSPAPQPARTLHAPPARVRAPASVSARMNPPVLEARATPSLFEPSSEGELLFGEPSI